MDYTTTIHDDKVPTRIGPYEVINVLGSGRFGEVFLAHDPRLDRKVAIKVPHPFLLSDKEDRDRFLWESKSLAKLKHPGIVTVHEVRTDEEQTYLVTEYLQGQSLAEHIDTHTLPYGKIIQIVAALGEALDHAHHHGIVHRDVKPANVVLVDQLNPVLVDFGVSLSLHGANTDDVQIAGTPAYMSPEQCRGNLDAIDGRSDQFSLGVILYRMLTGRPPFVVEQTVDEVLRIIQEEPPPRPSEVCRSTPRQLDAICLRALEKNPIDRFESCLEMADELNRAAHQLAPILGQIPGEQDLSHRSGQPSRQRRRVTLLACRTRLDMPLEADEEVEFDFLQAFRTTCRKIAGQRHGSLLESNGGIWLICFGYPRSDERVAEQAVQVGLDLLAACPGLAPAGIEVESTFVIHAGEVIIGNRNGSDQAFDITGRPRTQVMDALGRATPGAVYVTEAVHGTVARQYESSPHQVGEEAPLHRIGAPRYAGAPREAEAVLIGRDQELGLLLERWELVEDSISSGQTILLCGAAGIGKSRMVQILKEHVVASSTNAHILEWRCQPNRYDSAYFPIRDALEQAITWDPQIEPAKQWRRIVEYAKEIDLFEGDLPALLALLGQETLLADLEDTPDDEWLMEAKGYCEALATLSPNRYRELVKSGLLSWLMTLCRRSPVLLIVEDLHWIDPSSLEFLQSLIEKEGSLPIYILLTYRPEFRIPWEVQHSHTQIALNRLTRRQVREFLEASLNRDDIPEWLVREMVDKTEGNPLYLEEYARLVRQGDLLLEESSQSKLPGRIPDNLQDLVLANLDRSATHFSLVQQAAAIGREFSVELLRPVCQLEAHELQKALARLVTSGLLVDRGRKGGGTFAFKHSLTQDAAYGTLLHQDRRNVHQRIAETLEADFPDSKAEERALHHGEAGNYLQAVQRWTEAGNNLAVRRSAHLEAIGHLRRGLDLLRKKHPDGDVEATKAGGNGTNEWPPREVMELEILVPLGASLLSVYGYSASEPGAIYDRALELARKLNQPEKLIACTWAKGSWHVARNELPICLRMGDRVWDQAEATGNPYIRSGIRMLPSLAHFYRANYHESKHHCEEGLAMLRDIQADAESFKPFHIGMDPEVLHLGYLARNQWMLGLPDTARALLLEAQQLAESRNAPFELSFVHHISASMHKLAGNTPLALEHIEHSIKIAEEDGYGFWKVMGYLYRFSFWQDLDPDSDHTAGYEATLQAYQRSGARLALSKYYGYLATMYRQRNMPDKALSVLHEGYAHQRAGDSMFYLPDLLRLQGDLHLDQDANGGGAAMHFYEESFAEAKNTGSRYWMLRTATRMASLLQHQGETAKAIDILSPVHALFEEGKDIKVYQQASAILDELS